MIESVMFTVMHYKDKPNAALIGTLLVATLNCLVVLPHGILPMVIGHLLIDGVAFGMAPTMHKWIRQDRMKKLNMEEGCQTTASTRI
jgi:hypothetical protein